jgi:hypothetical protein
MQHEARTMTHSTLISVSPPFKRAGRGEHLTVSVVAIGSKGKICLTGNQVLRLMDWTIQPKVHTPESPSVRGSKLSKRSKESAMSTLHRIREFALVTMMITGALIASATQADKVGACERVDVARTYADLGHLTVTAQRSAEVAALGNITVIAQRLSDTRVADLGAITVTARRSAALLVADLGSLTVTATRIETLRVAARPSDRSWN